MKLEVPSPRSRILTSLLGLLFLVGAIPLLLFGARLTSFNREHLEVQQKEHQLVLAEAIAREVSEFIHAKQAAVEGFAFGLGASLALIEPEKALEAVRARGLLNRYLEQDPDLLKVMFATRAGGGRESSRLLEFVEASRVADPRLLAAAEERLVGSLLQRGLSGEAALETPGGEEPLLVVVQPVLRGDSAEAVISAIVTLRALQDRLEARSQQLYAVSLVDRAGSRFLAYSRAEGREALLASELVAAFRESGGTRTMPFAVERDGQKREMLGAFATVPETGWGVLVSIDSESAYYAVTRMRQTTIVWSLASVLLALVLGALFARRIVQPIRSLADGALRLARGDFSRPIELRSRNEIGLLAGSFNHMAEEIRQQMTELELAAKENKELFFASIRMLAEAIDEKDPYTRGHSERVSRYAVATARSFGLDVTEVEKVQVGALLHDVGKIGIDDRILRKESVLTDEEFEVMKQHPEKGAHIMGAVRQLGEFVPGARFHHEKVDGSGYPLGLKGDEIPLAAQIISVADTFDAMTTDRPYQRGMDPGFVVDKLKGWVGTRFRGDVVAAFDKAFREGAIEVKVARRAIRPAAAPASSTREA